MKKNRIFILIIALMLTFSGCSFSIAVENLLVPPKLTAEQNEIYQALINSAGNNIKLKYPKSGDYRSAFVISNIDDEPSEEALVFYELNSVGTNETALRVKILDKVNSQWISAYDIAGLGTEVESISFTSLGIEGVIDIVIGYSALNQTEKTVCIINYVNNTPVEVFKSPYSCMEIADLNQDKVNELIVTTYDKSAMLAIAGMYANTEEGFIRISSNRLDNSITEYVSQTVGFIDENTYALFLDTAKGASAYGTDVLYCYGNRLINPIENYGNINRVSRYSNSYLSMISCKDIDNDSFIEIPSTIPLPGYETLTRPEMLYATVWYTIKDNNLEMDCYSYYSTKNKFALIFPKRWQGVVTASYDAELNEIILLEYDSSKPISEMNHIMKIRSINIDDLDLQGINSLNSQGYKNLGQNGEAIYYVWNEASGNSLSLTESELEFSFLVQE